MISIKNLSFNYGSAPILKNINLKIDTTKIIGLAGLNGAGKTTLLKILLGIEKKYLGKILIKDTDLKYINQHKIAEIFAYLGIMEEISFNLTVLDLVKMGRFPYTGFWGLLTKKDQQILKQVLEETELNGFEQKYLKNLSAGEKQRAHLARVFAQKPHFLLLDEPFSHLDLYHQDKIAGLLKDKNQKEKIGMLIISHDINFLTNFCHETILLNKGEVIAIGAPKQVFTQENLFKAMKIQKKY